MGFQLEFVRCLVEVTRFKIALFRRLILPPKRRVLRMGKPS
jgi:hypothetical protein